MHERWVAAVGKANTVVRAITVLTAGGLLVACTTPAPSVTPEAIASQDSVIPPPPSTASTLPLSAGELGVLIELTADFGSSVMDLAWDVHVAVRRGDNEGATAAARDAIEQFREFDAQTADVEPLEPCMHEAWSAVREAIAAERQQWLAWSEGQDHPTEDDADVFFAFYGMPYPWGAMLRDARALCSPSS